jgi:hypothetical protein
MILTVFTFGIGMLWLVPYMEMTVVKFYENLRAEYEMVDEENEPVVMDETVMEETPAQEVE